MPNASAGGDASSVVTLSSLDYRVLVNNCQSFSAVVPDAVMDEITNVYTMGATAFALFAYGDRSPEAWPLNMALYDVVKKAVSDDRDERQQSIEFIISLKTVLGYRTGRKKIMSLLKG